MIQVEVPWWIALPGVALCLWIAFGTLGQLVEMELEDRFGLNLGEILHSLWVRFFFPSLFNRFYMFRYIMMNRTVVPKIMHFIPVSTVHLFTSHFRTEDAFVLSTKKSANLKHSRNGQHETLFVGDLFVLLEVSAKHKIKIKVKHETAFYERQG